MLASSACSLFDSGGSGDTEGSDETGEPPPVLMMEGHRVQCCFSGTWAGGDYSTPTASAGCAVPNDYECVRPGDYDTNADGELSGTELMPFCDLKCTPAWVGNEHLQLHPAWTPPGPPAPLALWTCTALSGSQVISENTCIPRTPTHYPEALEVPPTHEGTFTAGSGGSGNTVDLEITGNQVTPEATLDVQFAIDECDTAGYDGGTCRIVLRHFALTATSTFTSGDYKVLDASLSLADSFAADVDFDPCTGGTCTGTFAFAPRQTNPVSMVLGWTQRDATHKNTDDALISIGNDGTALGGIDALLGTLVMDPATNQGTLSLSGGGSDRLGGDWATLSFDIQGPVSKL